MQPYGHGGSKSANYPSVKKQAQTGKVLRKWAPVIWLSAAVVALGVGVIACSIAEHEAKLKAYRADPLAYDNKGFLAKALKDGDAERYNRIVNRRIDHLNDEIKTFNDNIDKIQKRGQ
ncbi:hypothetical protein NY546_08725 [Curtobacterium flaccumfaciens pv. flaccumfaciens]|uniref:hypothetical protein n=1 Tax=Curtobacterium flaccumfaciens TaxID=2035 RepID=UPI00265B21F6|nr:hypothetical protein [Curtobacterium flaccumfaciens]MCS5509374.1 hypothetical protein [Curtobacterium flaccumfaciens pv. flaccumfaciens]MCX2785768.1 hypothetical protein [Curtobacterium flaccumfaciens pv. flaccumfaciens]